MPKVLPKRQATLFASAFEGSFKTPREVAGSTGAADVVDDQLAFVFDLEPMRRRLAQASGGAASAVTTEAANAIVWTEEEVRLLVYAMVEYYQHELQATDQSARNYAYWWFFLDEDVDAPFSFPWFCKLHSLDLEGARDYLRAYTINPFVKERFPSVTAPAA